MEIVLLQIVATLRCKYDVEMECRKNDFIVFSDGIQGFESSP